MESMAEEIVREILLKLPTRDVARCRCVSRQWHRLLIAPSFIDLHVQASHGCRAETLVVTEIRGDRIGLDIIVRDSSSGKPVYRVTDLTRRYHPVNACSGFLLLAPEQKNRPLYVCNPVTGEKQKILPPPATMEDGYTRTYAMGFSPFTGQYKLFRLCLDESTSWMETWKSYMDICTLGDKGGGSWRRNPHKYPYSAADRSYPLPHVLVDGKLYVLTERPPENKTGVPDRMLVIDVASEAHCTYCLPEEFLPEVTTSVNAFELDGRLCIARHVHGRLLLRIWVMQPEPVQQQLDDMSVLAGSWELRYTFHIDNSGCQHDDWPTCAWVDDDGWPSSAWINNSDGMLCYRLQGCLYKYDITKKDGEHKKKKKKKKKKRKKEDKAGDFLEWHHQIKLPLAPPATRWTVYGGYRPNLFSPHNLVFRTNDKQEQYEQAFEHALRALRCKQSPHKQQC